jgi:hypothetical protein
MEITRISKALNNTGGPRSRTRKEPVRLSFLETLGSSAVSFQENIYFKLPDYCPDIPGYLLGLFSEKMGLSSWDAISLAIPLPERPLYVFPSLNPVGLHSDELNLVHALVLARCNSFTYQPDRDFIFTAHRLNRSLQLIEFNPFSFYGLE